MSDDRASRLRDRRRRTKEKLDTSDNPDNPDKIDETNKPDNTSKPSKSDTPTDSTETKSGEPSGSSTSVKADRPAQMMYLPEEMKREMDRQFGILETEYEYEFGDDFEKNRHYFPLLVQAGLDSLDELDVQDIKDKIDCIDG